MLDRGLLPSFSAAVSEEVASMQSSPAARATPDADASGIRDLTDLLWASIDNDDSRDLDQLTVAQADKAGTVRILVAIADVDSLVKAGSAVDQHARHNTTSVYTAAEIFPMLPEELSTGLTSLNANEDRLSVVVDLLIDGDGVVQDSEIYRARVRNHAKLAYNSVAAWLDGNGAAPSPITSVTGLADNLRRQDQVAQRLRERRHLQGALSLETIQSKPQFEGDHLRQLAIERPNRAKQIIEDFMVAANGATARYLAERQFPTIRRVVRTPRRWERIVSLAKEHGASLPDAPDSAALDAFLVKQKTIDPLHFADLSLAVIKLMGAGEYVAERPGGEAEGHFGLAVKDYAHSTAPNRRYPDLITQRLLKAALAGQQPPYSFDEQVQLAQHCTEAEDAANKVERQVSKSAAALLLESRIGERFPALITGASSKGTFARVLTVPVEGRVVRGFEGADVGDQVRVRLLSVDVDRGFIDFERVSR